MAGICVLQVERRRTDTARYADGENQLSTTLWWPVMPEGPSVR